MFINILHQLDQRYGNGYIIARFTLMKMNPSDSSKIQNCVASKAATISYHGRDLR